MEGFAKPVTNSDFSDLKGPVSLKRIIMMHLNSIKLSGCYNSKNVHLRRYTDTPARGRSRGSWGKMTPPMQYHIGKAKE